MSRTTLYHCPQTRSSGALMLVKELAADVDVKILDMKAGEQRAPAFLAVNPMGKVPALLDGDALVTEQVAIFLFLADRFAEKGLAPAIGDPLRGPYLRWMAFYGSSFEPACVDRAMKREPGPQGCPGACPGPGPPGTARSGYLRGRLVQARLAQVQQAQGMKQR